MDSVEFIQGVLRTRSAATGLRTLDRDLLHAAMGLCTEAGEFMDALKKAACHDVAIDTVNLREELSDILWYAALAAARLNTTFEDLMDLNQLKLKQRYPDGFTPQASMGRDVQAERVVLEQPGKD